MYRSIVLSSVWLDGSHSPKSISRRNPADLRAFSILTRSPLRSASASAIAELTTFQICESRRSSVLGLRSGGCQGLNNVIMRPNNASSLGKVSTSIRKTVTQIHRRVTASQKLPISLTARLQRKLSSTLNGARKMSRSPHVEIFLTKIFYPKRSHRCESKGCGT
jgi:hypothetical protein